MCPSCRQITQKRYEELPKNRLIVQLLELNRSQNLNPKKSINQDSPSTSSLQSLEINSNLYVLDSKNIYKQMFDEIDFNSDSRIGLSELHRALVKGNPDSQFDQKTAKLLLEKYDKDNDSEIDFNEFNSLFEGINNQYNEFLDFDKDSSGTIDSSELTSLLSKKGYNFNKEFIESLMNAIYRYTGQRNSVTFDLYVRIIARIDHLRNNYNHQYRHHTLLSFQKYLSEAFFLDF